MTCPSHVVIANIPNCAATRLFHSGGVDCWKGFPTQAFLLACGFWGASCHWHDDSCSSSSRQHWLLTHKSHVSTWHVTCYCCICQAAKPLAPTKLSVLAESKWDHTCLLSLTMSPCHINNTPEHTLTTIRCSVNVMTMHDSPAPSYIKHCGSWSPIWNGYKVSFFVLISNWNDT